MKKLKSALQLMLAFIISAALFSCHALSAKTADSTKTADSAAAANITAHVALAAPFDVGEITHNVKDYDKWKPFFNNDSTARKASGMEDLVVGRGVDDPNHVMIVLKLSDVAKAKAFAADPRLKDVMDKGGVVSKPDIQYFHVIRFNPDSHEKQWVVITHKVKDFDAWLKVYDGEGKEKRASEGMVDLALARGIDDPNLVHVVFDITDMAKAKASMSSDEKKKLMMSAGVMGTPKIEFYTTAE